MKSEGMKLTRLESLYERLVENTDNLSIIRDERQNRALQIMLDTIEYLNGNNDENPIDFYFVDPY